jgi:hypothetical protein
LVRSVQGVTRLSMIRIRDWRKWRREENKWRSGVNGRLRVCRQPDSHLWARCFG